MRILSVLFVVFAVAAAVPADDGAKKQAELKWARGVADDFLTAVKRQDSANVDALLVPEYAKLLKERTVFNPEPAEAVYERTKTFDRWTVHAEDISPDGDEAVFKGEFESESGTRAFGLRVIKDRALGRWRVGFLCVLDEKPAAKSKDPKR